MIGRMVAIFTGKVMAEQGNFSEWWTGSVRKREAGSRG
jgi:hypothetical protein